MRFLLFTLFAPMSSIGEIAVGERRPSWNRPSKSAVLGIVAAALGIKQTQDQAHRELHDQFNYAVETIHFGKSTMDYHTAQVPEHEPNRVHATRSEELSVETARLHTVISKREWRTDSYYIAVLWSNGVETRSLGSLEKALCNPIFTVYLGRKSAPFGLPLAPSTVEAKSLLEALDHKRFTALEQQVLGSLGEGESRSVAFDIGVTGVPMSNFRVERRRDGLLSRSRWQFDERSEGVLNLPPRNFKNDNADLLDQS